MEVELPERKSAAIISRINLCNSNAHCSTYLTHFITSDFPLKDTLTEFKFDAKDVDDFVVFYKTGVSGTALNKSKWNVYDGIRGTSYKVRTRDKFCRFIVIYKNNNIYSAMKVEKV